MKLLNQLAREYRLHGKSLRNPACWAAMTYRFGAWGKTVDFAPLRTAGDIVYWWMALAVELTSGITIHRDSIIDEDLHLVHSGNIKIDAGVRIGRKVGIMHNVTIAPSDDRPGMPVIGDSVYIGTGATILGPVVIGDGARVASNSLVLDDVPAGATAVGVPARVLRYTGRPSTAPVASVVPLPESHASREVASA